MQHSIAALLRFILIMAVPHAGLWNMAIKLTTFSVSWSSSAKHAGIRKTKHCPGQLEAFGEWSMLSGQSLEHMTGLEENLM